MRILDATIDHVSPPLRGKAQINVKIKTWKEEKYITKLS